MNSRTNLHIALAIGLTVIAAHTSSGDAPAIKADSIDPLVQPYIDGEIFNAVSIGVVQGDKTWTRHFGTLSKEASQQPSDSTIYEIGSIAKSLPEFCWRTQWKADASSWINRSER